MRSRILRSRTRRTGFGVTRFGVTGFGVTGFGVMVALVVSLSSSLHAQHASELTQRDKSEIFIQHLVKILKLDPGVYRSMVLEYEIGAALAEESPEIARDIAGLDFIHNSLRELYPSYAAAADANEIRDDAALEGALETLERDASAWANVYTRAYGGLLRAELALRAKRHDEVVARCEALTRDDRKYLIADARAAELTALAFQGLEKPLLEMAQWNLILLDYEEISPDLRARAEARLAELNGEVGRPLHTVAGWMNDVEKLLAEEKTGEDPTQKNEREILTALDKLIELQEAQERKSCKNCGSGNCQGCKSGTPKGNNSKNPADVSKLPGRGEGVVKLRGVSSADDASIWGLLEEKDAARALKSFGGRLPSRYERLLKEYYKALASEE